MDSKLNKEANENAIKIIAGKDEVLATTIQECNLVGTDYLRLKRGKLSLMCSSKDLLTKDGKIKLKRINELLKGKKINLHDVDVLNIQGKIDIFQIVNDDNDEKIDLFTYSKNIENDKLDLEKLTNSKNGKIDVFLLNGITDEAGQINFAKVFTGRKSRRINYNIINLDNYLYNGKLMLSKIKILNANSNIDIFDFASCITNGKIDQTKLCNSDSDDSIDIFEYTINHSDGKLDVSKFTNSEDGKIDIFKFKGIIDSTGSINFTKIFDSSHPCKFDFNLINLSKLLYKEKLELSKIQIFNGNKNIDLFDFALCISNGKIDQAKLCNSDSDNSIDIFKYTVNHSNNKIEITDFTNSVDGKLDLFMFNGVTDNEGLVDLTRVNFSKHSKKEIYSHIKSDKFYDGGKLILSKLKISSEEGKIDLFNFLDYAPYIINRKIDQTKICNSVSDESIDIFKYTTNFSNNKIELANFTNSIDEKIDLFKFNGITDSCGRVDFTRINYSRNLKKIIYSYINIDKFFHGGKLILSKIKISGERGKINLFDFPLCLYNGKIDQSRICNSDSDDSIDIFYYTVNHLNEKIDISKFTNSKNGAIDLLKFTGIKDETGQVDFTRIIESSN